MICAGSSLVVGLDGRVFITYLSVVDDYHIPDGSFGTYIYNLLIFPPAVICIRLVQYMLHFSTPGRLHKARPILSSKYYTANKLQWDNYNDDYSSYTL